MKNLLLIIFVAILLIAGVYLFTRQNQNDNVPPLAPTPVATVTPNAVDIDSFEDCVAAGYPVLESFPPRCVTPDGQEFTQDENTPSPTPGESDLITVTSPQNNQEVTSPLLVTGEARGNWYFEATFPVRLEDANGVVLVESFATAQGDWMTEEFVPFEATLEFVTPTTETGTLILEKANPSGLPENDDSIEIPVTF